MEAPWGWLKYYTQDCLVPVFPVNEKKHPLVPNGFKDATTDWSQIQQWWSKWPWAGIGMPTGAVSGYVVVDADAKSGGLDTAKWLVEEDHLDPNGLRVKTMNGGRHFYFKHPGFHVPNAVGIWPGIDIRGDGGYVVLPPSKFDGKGYSWMLPPGFSGTPLDAPLDAFPIFIANKLAESKIKVLSDQEKATLLKGVSQGQRIDTLKKLVGHFAAIGEGKETTRNILHWWNEKNQPPLELDELGHQFEEMWKKWGDSKASANLGEALEYLKELPQEDQHDAIVDYLAKTQVDQATAIKYADKFKKELGFPKQAFSQLVKIHKNGHDPDKAEYEEKVVVLTADQREEATEFLKDPRLLHRVLKHLKSKGLMGEEANTLLVYLSGTSRLLPDPIALQSQGESAAGKSYTMLKLLDLFPEEAKLVLHGLSPQALIYMPDRLSHKILAIQEWEGVERGLYNMRVMLSEKLLVFYVVIKDESGKFTTQRVVKEGPIALITTTTQVELEHQNETRQWKINPDESPEQTWRIYEALCRKWPGDPALEAVLVNAQRTLSRTPVDTPTDLLAVLGKLIKGKLPDPPVRFRRDAGRLVSALKSSALLHQYQRGQNDHGEIVPDIRDYYIMWRLASQTMTTAVLPHMNWKVRAVCQAVINLYQESYEPVEQSAVIEAVAPHGIKPNSVKYHLQKGQDAGVIFQGEKYKPWKPAAEYLGASSSVLGDLSILPEPQEVMEEAPELWVPGECFDPITGEEV